MNRVLGVLLSFLAPPLLMVIGALRNKQVEKGHFSRMLLAFLAPVGAGYGMIIYIISVDSARGIFMLLGYNVFLGLLCLWYFKTYGARTI